MIDIIENNVKKENNTDFENEKSDYYIPEEDIKKIDNEEIELETDNKKLEVQSEFVFDENAFLNTVSDNNICNIVDNPNELYNAFKKQMKLK